MKTIKQIALGLCAICSLVACTKDNASFETYYNAVFEAQLDPDSDLSSESKVSVNASGAVSWQSGDKILVAFTKSSINREFTNTGGNYFSGTISETDFNTVSGSGKYLYFCYPYTPNEADKPYRIKNFPTSGKNKNMYVDATQDGYLEGLGSRALFIGKYLCSEGALTLDKDKQISFNNGVSLNCITPIIKFNVPSSLGVKQIDIEAQLDGSYMGIATQFTIRNVETEKGVGVEGAETDVDENATPTISILRDGFEISGDVYVVLAPNYYNNQGQTFDARLKIDELDFTLTNKSDEKKILKLSVGTLYGGKITNLPGFPDSWSYSSPK